MTAGHDRFALSYRTMEAWLFDAALPLWARRGVDPNGGFFEKIGQDGQAIEAPRRTRVIGRQVYSYVAAGRMGWRGDWRLVVAHGLSALYPAIVDGLTVRTTTCDGRVIDPSWDFYDQAFAIFALAQAAALPEYRDRALTTANAMLDAMTAAYSHPQAGFREDRNTREPLRANPHMHMLEACLAMADAGGGVAWRAQADAIVALALERFIDPATGALREFFDFGWRPMSLPDHGSVEPGHQFEWAWLLHSWNRESADRQVDCAARRLAEVGEHCGLSDQDNVVIDELDDSLTVRTRTVRAWPQTERIKLCVERATLGDENGWWTRADEALAALGRCLATPLPGLWYDRLDAELVPVDQPAPASTLYHIVCALETAQAALTQNGRPRCGGSAPKSS